MFVLLAALYVVPIWCAKYFPSQDGPAHLYNAFILSHYHDPQFTFDRFYDVRLELFPNWVTHLALMALMRVVSPLAAEKLLLTAYVLLMAWSLVYLRESVGAGSRAPVLLAFPFIYHYPLLMGFYNFSIGVALFLVTIGYWWRHRQQLNAMRALTVAALLAAIYLCNPVPLVMAIVCIVAIAMTDLVSARPVRSVLPGLLCTVPAIVLIAYYAGRWGIESRGGGWTQDRLWPYFLHGGPLIFHGRGQIISAAIVTGLSGLLLVLMLGQRILAAVRGGRVRVEPRDTFLLLSALALVLYFVSPQALSEGAFLKPRLALFPFLLIVPALTVDVPARARKLFEGICLVVAAGCAAQVGYYHWTIAREISTYTSGLEAVDRNAVVLPLSFDYSGGSWLIGPIANAAGHYGVERGAINLMNYEADTQHFPTAFKPGLTRPSVAEVFVHETSFDLAPYKATIDYVITWSMPAGSEYERGIERYYRPVWVNGKLTIFKKAAGATPKPGH